MSNNADKELLAVDPGIRAPGVALFQDGLLVAAAAIKLDPVDFLLDDPAERVRRACGVIGTWFLCESSSPGTCPDVAWERPQWYRRGVSKGDPNDLGPLAIMGGHLGGMLGGRVYSYLPDEWTHGTKKTKSGDPWKSPRGIRLRALLSAEEFAAIGKATHDLVDAVGIGLHHLKRFGLKRIYSSH